jgi:hypothetical protein
MHQTSIDGHHRTSRKVSNWALEGDYDESFCAAAFRCRRISNFRVGLCRRCFGLPLHAGADRQDDGHFGEALFRRRFLLISAIFLVIGSEGAHPGFRHRTTWPPIIAIFLSSRIQSNWSSLSTLFDTPAFARLSCKRCSVLLQAILSWHEVADGRCRHKIFGDISWRTFGMSSVRAALEFSAHYAKQAFASRIEHAGS